MIVNEANLLNWYDVQPDPSQLPRPFTQNECARQSLMTFAGDTTVFYLNYHRSNPGWQLAEPPLLQLQHRLSGVLHEVTHDLRIDDDSVNSKAYLYGSITTPAVAPGIYQWVMTVGGEPMLVSTPVEVTSAANCNRKSVRVEYNNPTTLFNTRFPWVDLSDLNAPAGTSPRPSARVRMVAVSPSLASDSSSYRAESTGQRMTYSPSFERVTTFLTDFLDSDMLVGLSAALLHREVFFNGRLVAQKEAPAYTFSSRASMAQATFSVVDNSHALPLVP